MLAFRKMMEAGMRRSYRSAGYVAAVSAGIVDDVPLLDLCYEEDSAAMVDLNCVMDDQGRLIEIQGTGEERPFTLDEQRQLVELCEKGIRRLQTVQRAVWRGNSKPEEAEAFYCPDCRRIIVPVPEIETTGQKLKKKLDQIRSDIEKNREELAGAEGGAKRGIKSGTNERARTRGSGNYEAGTSK